MGEQSASRVATITMVSLVLATWAHVAHAQGQDDSQKPREKVLIFPFVNQLPDEQSAVPDQLAKVLEREARARKMRVTSADASLEDTAMISGCSATSDDCRTAILTQLGAERAFLGTVSPGPTPDQVVVSVAQFDVSGQSSHKEFTLPRDQVNREFAGALPVVFGDPVPDKFADNVTGGSSDMSLDKVSTSTWIVVGSGGAAMLTGSLFWAAAGVKQADIDAAPVESVEDLQALEELERSARTRAAIGNLLFVTGVAALGVGTFLAYRQMRSGGAIVPEASPAQSMRATAVVAPALLPGGLGLSFRAAW